MEKFIYRFFPTMQFVLGALAVLLFGVGFGANLFRGKFNLCEVILMGIAFTIVCNLTYSAYKEMVQTYKEEAVFEDFEDDDDEDWEY